MRAFCIPLLFGMLCLLSALAARTVQADVIHLKSGGTIEGTIIEEDTSGYKVKTQFGTQSFSKDQVARIEKKAFSTKKDEYKKRAAEVGPRDAEGYYKLGLWCKQNKMNAEGVKALKKAIKVDPEHAGAHQALGHIQFEGLWMTERDKERLETQREEAEYRAKGMELFRGEWVTPEEKEAIQAGKVKYTSPDGTVSYVSKSDQKKLEQGLVKYEGRWVSETEAENLKKGLFKVEGKFVDKGAANEYHSEWDNAWELESDHYLLITNQDYDYAVKMQEKAESTYEKMKEFFGEEPQLYGDKLYIYMFRTRDGYNQFGRANAGNEEGFRQSAFGGFYAGDHDDTPAVINAGEYTPGQFDFAEYHLYHSLAVQYIAEVQPNISSAWIRQSIVSYFQYFVFYPWPSLRQDWGKYVIGNRFIPLSEYMELTSLSDNPDNGYYVGGDKLRQQAQGGLLILYLTKAGPTEYHDKFKAFLEKMKKSSLDTEAFQKVFNVRKLEEDFVAWIENLQ